MIGTDNNSSFLSLNYKYNSFIFKSLKADCFNRRLELLNIADIRTHPCTFTYQALSKAAITQRKNFVPLCVFLEHLCVIKY